MTVLEHDDVIKTSCDLYYYFIIFERSYVVSHSCAKFHSSGLNWFRIYGGGGGGRALSAPQVI